MGKASRVPAALVRGVAFDAATVPISELVRPPEEDLFRSSPLLSISERRTIRAFGAGDVPREAVERPCGPRAAPAPHPRGRGRSARSGHRLRSGGSSAPSPRPGAGTSAVTGRRRRRSSAGSRGDAVLGAAPVLIVPWVRFEAPIPTPTPSALAEQEMFLLSGGAAIQGLLLALSAQGFASCWISSTLFCQEESRAALGMSEDWFALGTVAAGPMPAGAASPRPARPVRASADRVIGPHPRPRPPRGRSTRRRSQTRRT